MPESKTDRAHRTIEEIAHYHDCGDARGREWLDAHPEAREHAALELRNLKAAEVPLQQGISAA